MTRSYAMTSLSSVCFKLKEPIESLLNLHKKFNSPQSNIALVFSSGDMAELIESCVSIQALFPSLNDNKISSEGFGLNILSDIIQSNLLATTLPTEFFQEITDNWLIKTSGELSQSLNTILIEAGLPSLDQYISEGLQSPTFQTTKSYQWLVHLKSLNTQIITPKMAKYRFTIRGDRHLSIKRLNHYAVTIKAIENHLKSYGHVIQLTKKPSYFGKIMDAYSQPTHDKANGESYRYLDIRLMSLFEDTFNEFLKIFSIWENPQSYGLFNLWNRGALENQWNDAGLNAQGEPKFAYRMDWNLYANDFSWQDTSSVHHLAYQAQLSSVRHVINSENYQRQSGRISHDIYRIRRTSSGIPILDPEGHFTYDFNTKLRGRGSDEHEFNLQFADEIKLGPNNQEIRGISGTHNVLGLYADELLSRIYDQDKFAIRALMTKEHATKRSIPFHPDKTKLVIPDFVAQLGLSPGSSLPIVGEFLDSIENYYAPQKGNDILGHFQVGIGSISIVKDTAAVYQSHYSHYLEHDSIIGQISSLLEESWARILVRAVKSDHAISHGYGLIGVLKSLHAESDLFGIDDLTSAMAIRIQELFGIKIINGVATFVFDIEINDPNTQKKHRINTAWFWFNLLNHRSRYISYPGDSSLLLATLIENGKSYDLFHNSEINSLLFHLDLFKSQFPVKQSNNVLFNYWNNFFLK